MAGRGGIRVASVFLLVLAFQWHESHAARPMGAPKSTEDALPRLSKERKLLEYDYTRDSEASWDGYSMSSTDTSGLESNDDDEVTTFIDSPETAYVQSSVDRDPNIDDVFYDTSMADTVYSAASTD